MNFSNLPPACPPEKHETNALQGVYRVLVGEEPIAYDWQTHLERGKVMPRGMDPCKWASLSLFNDTSVVRRYKNLQDCTHAAKLDIPAGSGAHQGKEKHIHFWANDNTDVTTCVVQIVELP
ncbi:MAG: hypothetical protein QNI87_06195 [Erythrobacter sp.]|uniref:hypothetical protein n=1 Tax=Erythrobacter sp. TaxID=1042 RepID=UPI0026386728|nr:hypothetical protein [Erythrobacter sp.]MDJ0978106.1 hypothetical protein [Erythrobacter sp.]